MSVASWSVVVIFSLHLPNGLLERTDRLFSDSTLWSHRPVPKVTVREANWARVWWPAQNEDQKHGVEIVKKAITWPARQIAINAGEDGSVIVGKILEKDQYAFGFDAQDGEYADLVKKGIIDPTKVVRRIALQDGASIAGLLITTEAMVAEKPKKNAHAGHAAGWWHGLLMPFVKGQGKIEGAGRKKGSKGDREGACSAAFPYASEPARAGSRLVRAPFRNLIQMKNSERGYAY
jgi:TCP-1/cpn60 chaperonin family